MLRLRRTESRFIRPWDQEKFWSVWYQDSVVGAVLATFGASDDPACWDWIVQLHAGRFGNGNPAPLFARPSVGRPPCPPSARRSSAASPLSAMPDGSIIWSILRAAGRTTGRPNDELDRSVVGDDQEKLALATI